MVAGAKTRKKPIKEGLKMRTSKVVEQLRNQGHKVSVYKRPDGGIRITKIDGIKFTLSEGNAFARELIGKPSSAASHEQRQKARQEALKGKKRQKAKMPSLTIRKGDSAERRREKRELKKAVQKARKVLRKSNKKLGAEQISKKIKREGYKKAASRILNTARHEAGLAYEAHVTALIDYMKMVYKEAGLDCEYEVAILNQNKEHFADSFIKIVYQDIYQIVKGVREGWDTAIINSLTIQVTNDVNAGVQEGLDIYNTFK